VDADLFLLDLLAALENFAFREDMTDHPLQAATLGLLRPNNG
jgi:hypothetical protein